MIVLEAFLETLKATCRIMACVVAVACFVAMWLSAWPYTQGNDVWWPTPMFGTIALWNVFFLWHTRSKSVPPPAKDHVDAADKDSAD